MASRKNILDLYRNTIVCFCGGFIGGYYYGNQHDHCLDLEYDLEYEQFDKLMWNWMGDS